MHFKVGIWIDDRATLIIPKSLYVNEKKKLLYVLNCFLFHFLFPFLVHMFSSDENAYIMFILMNYGYALFRKK